MSPQTKSAKPQDFEVLFGHKTKFKIAEMDPIDLEKIKDGGILKLKLKERD